MTQAERSVDEHLDAILASVAPLEGLDLTLSDAHGSVLVEDIAATFPLPPFDNAALDGYAVRSEDIAAATVEAPVSIPVVGDVSPGSTTPYTVQPGLCVRIMAGAPIPPGADVIVPADATDGGVAHVAVRTPLPTGTGIRRTGEDAASGARVLAAGTHLGATQLGLLAAVGRERVLVRPRPRVVVIATGSELVDPGQPLTRGQIPDVNSALLTAAALEAGAIAYRVGIVPDEPGLLADTLDDQLIRSDVIVTTGGVSAGASDVVKEIMARVGTVGFHDVAMDPGVPQGFGTVGPDHTPFFALPGNPVAAYVSFEVFVRPALRRMLGVEPIARPTVRARVTEAVSSPAGRRSYLRGWLSVENGEYSVRPVGGSGSHLVASLAASNALIVVPETATSVEAGGVVTVLMLERRQQ